MGTFRGRPVKIVDKIEDHSFEGIEFGTDLPYPSLPPSTSIALKIGEQIVYQCKIPTDHLEYVLEHLCCNYKGEFMGGFKLMSMPTDVFDALMKKYGHRLLCKTGECAGGLLMSKGQSTVDKTHTILQFYNVNWRDYVTDHKLAVQYYDGIEFEALPDPKVKIDELLKVKEQQ